MASHRGILLVQVLLGSVFVALRGSELKSAEYGVDVSFPIHGYIKDKKSHFSIRYEKSMAGCYKDSSRKECDATERARIEMNLEQPRSQHNYTEIGFKKTRVPDDLWREISEFYEAHKTNLELEAWPPGNTYVNNWESPTYMISFEDKTLRGALDLKQRIWDGVKPIISEWVGKDLIDTSLYGIRVYKDGAILATHVDRLPLVSSCIIQVAQDIDEPWPVEVIAHDGTAHNVSMVPGDMVLYESHSVLHGRPFPLVGRHYANIFVHFIPTDHDEMNEKDHVIAEAKKPPTLTDRIKSVFGFSKKQLIGGHEQDNHDESAVQRHRKAIDEEEEDEEELVEAEEDVREEAIVDSEADSNSERENEDLDAPPSRGEKDGMTALHIAASEGNLAAVEAILDSFDSGSVNGSDNNDMLHARDANDWQAMHEAAVAGHLDVLMYLVERGADVGAVTRDGGTALWWAKKALKPGHPVISYLEEIGAPDEGGMEEDEQQAEEGEGVEN